MVSRESLSRVARKIGLGECLVLGIGEEKNGGRDRDSILADGIEALMGAIFCDSSYSEARKVILKIMVDAIGMEADMGHKDSKTELQEITQKRYGSLPVYRLIDQSGAENSPVYRMGVWVGGTKMGEGIGRSKKGGSKMAAQIALEKMRRS